MIGALTTAATAALAFFATVGTAAPATDVLAKRAPPLRFDYNNDNVRGVNLGGWFVLEPWITPSLFEEWSDGNGARGEWTYSQILGKDEAYRRLSNHWNSWITADDFRQIAAAGMNHVRLPIGYWSIIPVDGEPFVQGAYEKLGEALDWASQAGLKVMIDLHGAKGSQNGFDNSGHYGAVNFGQGDSIDHTLRVLNKIRDDHADHPAVSSIAILNEPMASAIGLDKVKQFYMDAWGNLKDSGVAVVFSDAFEGVNAWNDWGSGMWYLVEDTHHYQIFDNSQVAMSVNDHISTACSFGGKMASNNKWTVAGEWTGALTDCTKWLNGLGKGARYDGTLSGSAVGSCDGKYIGTVDGLSGDDKTNIRRYIEAQLDGFEKATGWIFWTWKTESSPEWDMQALIKGGLFPQPLSDRQYPGQCS